MIAHMKLYAVSFRKHRYGNLLIAFGLVFFIFAAHYYPYNRILLSSPKPVVRNDYEASEDRQELEIKLGRVGSNSDSVNGCCCSDHSKSCCCTPTSNVRINCEVPTDKRTNYKTFKFVGACGPVGSDEFYFTASLILFNTKQPTTIVLALLRPVCPQFDFRSISQQQLTSRHRVDSKSPLPYYLLYNTYRC